MQGQPKIHNQDEIYEVFARFKYEEPLHQVGTVIAPNVELAKSYAFNTYNEWAWIEMIIVPRRDVITVIKTP
jgi:1,2-phenylacetyl-CoA epoxidase PaaB subunit